MDRITQIRTELLEEVSKEIKKFRSITRTVSILGVITETALGSSMPDYIRFTLKLVHGRNIHRYKAVINSVLSPPTDECEACHFSVKVYFPGDEEMGELFFRMPAPEFFAGLDFYENCLVERNLWQYLYPHLP